jgi:uncharacterized protein HemX
MNEYLTPQNLFDGAMLAIIVVAAIATWQNSKSAQKSTEDQDALAAIQLKDATLAEFKNEIIRLNTIVTKQGQDIAELKVLLKTKDEAIEKYLEIVKNYNPHLEQFMKDTSESIKIIERFIETWLRAQSTNVIVNN